MFHVLDAHAILWYLEDPEILGTAARQVLNDRGARLVVPTIALAETRWALEKKRMSGVWPSVLARVGQDDRLDVYPLTLEVLAALKGDLEMHDAIICATAFVIGERTGDEVTVITRDREIRDSGLVQTVW